MEVEQGSQEAFPGSRGRTLGGKNEGKSSGGGKGVCYGKGFGSQWGSAVSLGGICVAF